jgi:hypothetical protein
MGTYHILTVSEDALVQGKGNPDLKSELGAAVITLCIEPTHAHLGGPKLERVSPHSLFNHSTAMHHVCDLHHSDNRMLYFRGGSAHELDDLSKEELLFLKDSIEVALSKVVQSEK